jgi:hypothetical protein
MSGKQNFYFISNLLSSFVFPVVMDFKVGFWVKDQWAEQKCF